MRALLLLFLPATWAYTISSATTTPGWYWPWLWSVRLTNFSYELPTPSGAQVSLSDLRFEVLWLHWWMNGTKVSSCGGRVTPITLRTAHDAPMCLDSGLEPVPGRTLKVWECLGDVPQQTWEWTVEGTGDEANSTYRLYNTDLCVEHLNGFGGGVALATCNASNTFQLWKTRGQNG